jgi:hypothetical protein
MTDVSDIAERAHLGLYGVAAQHVGANGGRRV